MEVGESKVSQRGSVVIPKAIRKALGINEGDFLVWEIVDQTVVVKKKVSQSEL